jgi:NAD-dependent histone deacetylase SIR2
MSSKTNKRVLRMESVTGVAMHGTLGNPEWQAPRVVAKSEEDARPGYSSKSATEYLDEPDVLEAKMTIVAQLIKKSKKFSVYSGAGMSTSSGIGDYATKAKSSIVAVPFGGTINRLKAQPTYSHHMLASLEKKGYLQHWVQQNHDGLAQKAGYPKEKLNEIHGSWFDKKNPVVLMDDSVRSDLFDWLCEWEQETDLCMVLGSSLCGMNADRIAITVAKKALENSEQAQGLVIVNLQQTQHDDKCQIRVFAKIDDAMEVLARKLKMKVSTRVK